ncbi:hypothetical protein D9M69_424970 [compost metagenome]
MIFGRLFAQPGLGQRRDVAVVEGIGRLARPGLASHFPGTATTRQVLAHQPHQVAFAFDDVHRHNFLAKAVVIIHRAEMQLADRNAALPAAAHAVVPTGYRAVIRVGVVPKAHLMDVAPGGERRSRRDAYR